MFKQLRLKLTLFFVLLSFSLFLAMGAVGTWICYKSMTDGLDERVHTLIVQQAPGIEQTVNTVRFEPQSRNVSTRHGALLARIELYDKNGNLLQGFGPHRIGNLLLHDHDEPCVECEADDGQTMRIGAHELLSVQERRRVVGYLQVAVPTDLRDKAVQTFVLWLSPLMPLFLIVLAVAGYFFSARASRPVETASALLRQFLADAGHELKTPIQAIQLTAENVHEETNDSELRKDMDTITRAAQRMTRLVEDMLLLAKYELQQLPMKRTHVRMDELLKNLIDEFTPAYEEKQIELELSNYTPAIVNGDSHLLQRLFSNLFQNALRYTDSQGKVTVSMSVANDILTVFVADTGIGIAPEAQKKIFDRFYRADKSRARAAGGSGLGLAIVQAICQMHSGLIGVQSEPGKGSTFQVALPTLQFQPFLSGKISVSLKKTG